VRATHTGGGGAALRQSVDPAGNQNSPLDSNLTFYDFINILSPLHPLAEEQKKNLRESRARSLSFTPKDPLPLYAAASQWVCIISGY
jgi:hypothetical protein